MTSPTPPVDRALATEQLARKVQKIAQLIASGVASDTLYPMVVELSAGKFTPHQLASLLACAEIAIANQAIDEVSEDYADFGPAVEVLSLMVGNVRKASPAVMADNRHYIGLNEANAHSYGKAELVALLSAALIVLARSADAAAILTEEVTRYARTGDDDQTSRTGA